MPRIFDNLTPSTKLAPALKETLSISNRADFCVGYLNMRGWGDLAPFVDRWNQKDGPCRVLIGMQRLPNAELRDTLTLKDSPPSMDNATAHRLRTQLAEQLRQQLTFGFPTNADESALHRLAEQLRDKRVIVSLFLRHTLHAKLYLLFRDDPNNPITGYLGSSNLTMAGLSQQGELNVDVLDHDATNKLRQWFEDRWNDRFCIDITEELLQIIEESWARQALVPPYHVYLKMAYHLSNEARAGIEEFKIPSVFGNRLFEFQTAAVKIAAHHLNRRNGVLIGDVVGLGKTLIATALARIFEDDLGTQTLIICPKNLVPMWEKYRDDYGLRARVLSISQVLGQLPNLRRYHQVIVDESHNLRNRDGKRYRAISEYISENESKCILLSATPYNKTYHDLSNQLRLFISEEQDLGIRPEQLLRNMGEGGFRQQHQASPRSLAAFEHSEYPDDWRDLMRLYMVRRTRSFVQDNYAETDPETARRFLTFEDGNRSYFPARVPKTVGFAVNDADPNDQYARMYAPATVAVIEKLHLPRYGLGNYVRDNPATPPTAGETRQIQNLARAGKRLMGFCRTNLFKRLESSGAAFVQSVERHALRNYIFLHALRNGLPLPVGTQDAEMLDSRFTDEDLDEAQGALADPDDDMEQETDDDALNTDHAPQWTPEAFEERAERIYEQYATRFRRRFTWVRHDLFRPGLETELQHDADELIALLQRNGQWNPTQDAKLEALQKLITKSYPDRKIIVFSQFADTVRYLAKELQDQGVDALAGVTGDSPNPTAIAWRFSPVSNEKRQSTPPDSELRVLIATDVLSEGQNLQDCAIVVNYDLPWAIIRLIQRAGRVDRIGQTAEEILCHSFMPSDGVERIINLRGRVRDRLRENAEVVGTDEAFFEDDQDDQPIINLYNERAGILDGDGDGEVDLTSQAYQIWKNAITADRRLERAVTALPDVVFSSRQHHGGSRQPEGALVYLRTADDNDSLAYIGRDGQSITESPVEILNAAQCHPDTPAFPRHEDHHELVAAGAKHIAQQARSTGGQLGRPSSARYRSYNRLKEYADSIKGQLFESEDLRLAVNDIYRYPLRQAATDTLNRQMRSGIDDPGLAHMVIQMRNEDRLCLVEEDNTETQEPRIICSMGLFDHENDTANRQQEDGYSHSLSIITVSTGNDAPWSRDDIYDDHGR